LFLAKLFQAKAVVMSFFMEYLLKLFFVAVFLSFSLQGCILSSDSDNPDPIVQEPGKTDTGLEPAEPNTVRFIAVGDVGTGTTIEYRVAKAMGNKCELDGCNFVLLLGDNIYENGVDSISDTQFGTKFKKRGQVLQYNISRLYFPLWPGL
jgi:hypothetical protein